jgi:predicted DNA-binding mobile mystery protein A
MKQKKSYFHDQRRTVDRKLTKLSALKEVLLPRMGWVKAIRESLGLTTRQLAMRLGIKQSSIVALEAREARKEVTLESLEKVAKAMDCTLIYAIVPSKRSLDSILEDRSVKAAERIMKTVRHSMKLEDQSVDQKEDDHQLKALAMELKASFDPRLWEDA